VSQILNPNVGLCWHLYVDVVMFLRVFMHLMCPTNLLATKNVEILYLMFKKLLVVY